MNNKVKPKKDISGQCFGELTAEEYQGDSKWLCKCKCGNTVVVRTCNLTNGHTKSCGCISAKQSALNGRKSLIDLTGRKFGRLTVKEYRGGSKWLCECECGRKTIVAQNNLCRKTHAIISCGCAVTLDNANEANIAYGTNIGNIKTNKALPNSQTGIRGVHYSKTSGLYIATIGFQGKQYVLKSSTNIDECITAREEAEKNIFGDFLEWYESIRNTEEEE